MRYAYFPTTTTFHFKLDDEVGQKVGRVQGVGLGGSKDVFFFTETRAEARREQITPSSLFCWFWFCCFSPAP